MMAEAKQTTGTRSGSRRTAAARWGCATPRRSPRGDAQGCVRAARRFVRRGWRIEEPHFLGHETNHLTSDPRDGTTWLLAAKTGHLGPTVFRSTDGSKAGARRGGHRRFPRRQRGTGRRWTGSSVSRRAREPAGRLVGGALPHALFRSEDGGVSWELVVGFSDYLDGLRKQEPPRFFPTPGGAITRSWWTHATPTTCTSLSRQGDASRPPMPARAGAH